MVWGKRKLLDGSRNNDNDNNVGVLGEDRVSELSDPILLHILSFLPTKCAVSTSILSRRWRYIWTSIPVLDFRCWRSYNIKESLQTRWFMRFMDRMLALHDGMPNIKEFYLDFDKNLSVSRVNAWISTLVQRKVENIHLIIQHRFRSFMLPPCLFTCESLTTLEIRMDNPLKLPESISLPKLKILRLKHIDFVDGELTQQFFSNCPMLEELSITECIWSMKFVCISVPTLKYLTFGYNGKEEDGFLVNCVVKVYAPSLLSLGYRECVARDYDLCSFSSLVDANIDLLREDYWASMKQNRVMGNAANKLVQKLSNVKLLNMSYDTLELLSFADDLLTNLPTFHNLIRLEVTSTSFPSKISIFIDFLQIMPNLESIVFAQAPCGSDNDGGGTLNVVPECLLLHLKTVEFHTYRCLGFSNLSELTWVKLFLKNALVLQRMTIIVASSFSSENIISMGSLYPSEKVEISKEVKEEILMFPRASTNCIVEFSSSYNI